MPWYTDLKVVFDAFEGREHDFDWLLTDLDCNWFPPELRGDQDAWFFSGSELSNLVHQQDPPVQFIWAVLTGFERGALPDPGSLKLIPRADGNPDLWRGTPRIQHAGALVELVCWDSGATFLLTADAELTMRFRAAFPEAVDLATFNARREDAG